MPFKCEYKICKKYETNNKNGVHYANQEKYCSICKVMMIVGGNRCPCCNSSLRTHTRHKNRYKTSGDIYNNFNSTEEVIEFYAKLGMEMYAARLDPNHPLHEALRRL